MELPQHVITFQCLRYKKNQGRPQLYLNEGADILLEINHQDFYNLTAASHDMDEQTMKNKPKFSNH